MCTDLLTIGDGTVIRKDTFLTGYRAHAGVIQTGPVTLGRDVFVGERGARHRHLDGRRRPARPRLLAARRAGGARRRALARVARRSRPRSDYQTVDRPTAAALRRARHASRSCCRRCWPLYLPLAVGGLALLLDRRCRRSPHLSSRACGAAPSRTFYGDALVVSLVLFFGGIARRPARRRAPSRACSTSPSSPDRVYPLYGFHYRLHRAIAPPDQPPFFIELFGDSSYIVHYLRWLGYDL